MIDKNPYRTLHARMSPHDAAWDEGFAAGRAAATETIPREDALQALHEMSTVAGLLRVRRDDPAVVALGDRLRLACRALRDVTAPGMNELMDSQPGRAAATPGPPSDRNIARMFHEVYERLAPTFGYRTREESAVPWEKVPAKNRDLMTATVGAVRAHLAAASPDERLREALAFYADKGNYTAQNPVGSGAHVWRDMGGRARAALAAADREKPDKPHTQDCQDAMFMHHAATGGDMECTCRPPVSDDPVNDPETDT